MLKYLSPFYLSELNNYHNLKLIKLLKILINNNEKINI